MDLIIIRDADENARCMPTKTEIKREINTGNQIFRGHVFEIYLSLESAYVVIVFTDGVTLKKLWDEANRFYLKCGKATIRIQDNKIVSFLPTEPR